ncbi:unnamed protein product, partial [Prorocentrum cordatum]
MDRWNEDKGEQHETFVMVAFTARAASLEPAPPQPREGQLRAPAHAPGRSAPLGRLARGLLAAGARRRGRRAGAAAAIRGEPDGACGGVARLDSLAAAGDVAAATAAFEVLSARAPVAKQTMLWNLVLKAHAKAGDARGARAWFEDMVDHGIRVNLKTLGKLVESAANAGLLYLAEQWIFELLHPATKTRRLVEATMSLDDDEEMQAYSMAINASAKAGDVERAVAWIQRLQALNLLLAKIPFSTVVHAYAKQGDIMGASRWFHAMLDMQITPDAVAYGAMIDACAKGREWGRALELLRGAGSQHGGAVDSVSYTAMADACAKRGDSAGAAHWLGKMEQAQCAPNVLSYNTVLDACSRTGATAQASRWLGRMMRSGVAPNEYTYTTIISSCARRKDAREAAEWLRAMQGARLEPRVAAYNAVLDACAKRGDAEGAAGWMRAMRDARLTPDEISYTALVDSCAQHGDTDGADRWLREMEECQCGPSVAAHNAAISSCAKAGDALLAVERLERMARSALRPDVISYNAVINSHARGEDPPGALRWLEKIEEDLLTPSVVSYNTVVGAYARQGDPDSVATVLERMSSAGLQPNEVTWALMLQACANAIPRTREPWQPSASSGRWSRRARVRTRLPSRRWGGQSARSVGLRWWRSWAWATGPQAGPPLARAEPSRAPRAAGESSRQAKGGRRQARAAPGRVRGRAGAPESTAATGRSGRVLPLPSAPRRPSPATLSGGPRETAHCAASTRS